MTQEDIEDEVLQINQEEKKDQDDTVINFYPPHTQGVNGRASRVDSVFAPRKSPQKVFEHAAPF